MPTLFGLLLTIGLLLFSVMKGIYIGWSLAVGYIYFVILYLRRGLNAAQILAMTKTGARRAFIVIPILLLIGCVVASWLAAGTVGAFVYYSLSLISPPLFIFFAFVVCSLVSMLLGTSFGTCGTIGVILMVLARGGGVNPYIVAGAIISGIYVGDRCSPMASALYLLSAVTETDNYRNIAMSVKTTVPPYLLSAGLYLLVSIKNPLIAGNTSLQQELLRTFDLGWPAFLPALLIVVLSCLKTGPKIAMLVSAACAIAVAILVQGQELTQMAVSLLWGYQLGSDHALAQVMRGGGMWGMARTGFILLTACSLTGVLEGAGALDGLEKLLLRPCGRLRLYFRTMAVSLLGICCGCSQSIAMVVAGQLMRRPYEQAGLDNYVLARDISFTAIPLAAAVPWCVAASVPMATLGIELPLHLPYLFFPFMVPICYGLIYAWQERGLNRKACT